MNSKRFEIFLLLILIGLLQSSFAHEENFKENVCDHSCQLLPGIDEKEYDIDKKCEFDDFTLERLPYWDSKGSHKIKDLHRAIATTKKIFKRPLQVIGILEYRGTAGNAECIDDVPKKQY